MLFPLSTQQEFYSRGRVATQLTPKSTGPLRAARKSARTQALAIIYGQQSNKDNQVQLDRNPATLRSHRTALEVILSGTGWEERTIHTHLEAFDKLYGEGKES